MQIRISTFRQHNILTVAGCLGKVDCAGRTRFPPLTVNRCYLLNGQNLPPGSCRLVSKVRLRRNWQILGSHNIRRFSKEMDCDSYDCHRTSEIKEHRTKQPLESHNGSL